MKTVWIVLLLVAALSFSWVAESGLRKRLLSELLRLQKAGRQKQYFQLLNGPISLICLPVKTRRLLSLDYYLAYGNEDKIKQMVNLLIAKYKKLDSEQAVLIRLMRCYIFFLDKKSSKEADKLANYLLKNCHLKEVQDEVNELYQVYLAPNKKLLDQLKQQLSVASEPQQQLIIYQRLAKATEILGLRKQEQTYVMQMRKLAHQTIKMEEF
ncbi:MULTISPECIES: hypothetical protein [unclassified Lactobacillus]|uniref:hypothetical protein n=1 Tax=unclassified Lactobacillus TaxID=2620435 RepID=UPI00226AA203|nr:MULTISPECIES: hypothetical protein [unclassified Lactobacillus]MCX8720445.1 hypothetical protein [Lactobacillus sp. B4010]MCX8731532.1 hypothetical protein [Lactobacillus sp. B4015]MCX8733753.1 hypothetical protein [Lactobacillus sp. B4012]